MLIFFKRFIFYKVISKKNIEFNSSESNILMVLLSLISNSEQAFIKNKIKNKNIELIIKEIDNNIEFILTDNAGGIDNKIIERIFEPYFTTEHQTQNKGLSLFSTYESVTNYLYGNIYVENYNDGLKVVITLPKEV